MPTQIYKVDGIRVPSVTTILSRFKEAGGLIEWAYKCGCDGINIHDVKNEAASAGTVAHLMIEADIRQKPGPKKDLYPIEVWNKAISGFSAYLEWKEQSNLCPMQSELGLVCECHRFGGCLDSVSINSKLSLLDWKTSGGIYGEYLCQLAAYGHLFEVNYPNMPIDGGYHIVRFSKEDGSFHHSWWPDLSIPWESFKLMRQLYDLDKKIKGML
jgi:hypothetical protein